MAVTAQRVSVGMSPTALASGPAWVAGIKGLSVRVRVPALGSPVSVGASNVAATTGFELVADETLELEIAPGESLYGIVAAGTQIVHVLTTTGD